MPPDKLGHPLSHNLRFTLSPRPRSSSAPDLRAFAEWAEDPTLLDYLAPLPDKPRSLRADLHASRYQVHRVGNGILRFDRAMPGLRREFGDRSAAIAVTRVRPRCRPTAESGRGDRVIHRRRWNEDELPGEPCGAWVRCEPLRRSALPRRERRRRRCVGRRRRVPRDVWRPSEPDAVLADV